MSWQPNVGPSSADLYAMLAAVNNRMREIQKEMVYINGLVWAEHKRVEELIQSQPPSPMAPKPR